MREGERRCEKGRKGEKLREGGRRWEKVRERSMGRDIKCVRKEVSYLYRVQTGYR